MGKAINNNWGIEVASDAQMTMPLSMIHRLVQSAFQTGYLSVESEGLIQQVIAVRSYGAADLSALEELHQAIHTGQVKREAGQSVRIFTLP